MADNPPKPEEGAEDEPRGPTEARSNTSATVNDNSQGNDGNDQKVQKEKERKSVFKASKGKNEPGGSAGAKDGNDGSEPWRSFEEDEYEAQKAAAAEGRGQDSKAAEKVQPLSEDEPASAPPTARIAPDNRVDVAPESSTRETIKKNSLRNAAIHVGIGAPNGPSRLFERRSPFIHNPPYPEERRSRISNPRSPKDYIINLREDLADFQESHGLPRSRDYSFFSLGLSLAQETGRAIYAVFLMITELFPVIAIVSLILRFALDKLIEILETEGTTARLKKSVVFGFQILVIMIPLWILVGTIIIPLFYLILSIFRRLFRVSGRKKGKVKSATRRAIAAPTGKKAKAGGSCAQSVPFP